ncbi:hypothetical protein Taro_001384, partial [Colocasia esculenta]|nr:hypothetical protein [Colocasia esculenta]
KFRHIDIIVSNAAANPTTDNILDTKESVLDKLWEINVKASILLIQPNNIPLGLASGWQRVYLKEVASRRGGPPFPRAFTSSEYALAVAGGTRSGTSVLVMRNAKTRLKRFLVISLLEGTTEIDNIARHLEEVVEGRWEVSRVLKTLFLAIDSDEGAVGCLAELGFIVASRSILRLHWWTEPLGTFPPLPLGRLRVAIEGIPVPLLSRMKVAAIIYTDDPDAMPAVVTVGTEGLTYTFQ